MTPLNVLRQNLVRQRFITGHASSRDGFGLIDRQLLTQIIAPQKRPLSSSSSRSGGRRIGSAAGTKIPTYIWVPTLATAGLLGYGYFAFLDEVPLTHRKRWIATSPQWEEQLGDNEYKQLLQHFRKKGQVLPADHRASVTVKRVGSNIAKAAAKFAQEHDLAHFSKAPWTYTVVRSDMANAFVLPNNHVFVMTGLFKYIRDEDDLAAVLGHECAHNLARHAGEKMSSSVVVNLLARLSLIIDPSGFFLAIFLPATSLLRELPHSRTQETEADHIGLFLAAEACYDPRAAKRVFAAMKKDMDDDGNSRRAPPEFLSTHPSHDNRISHFDNWLPDAMKVYNGDEDAFSDTAGDRCRTVRQQMQMARKDAAYRAALREQQ